jgi:hypothetical protein
MPCESYTPWLKRSNYTWTYSKAKLKNSDDKTSPCFRPLWTGKLSDKCLPIRTLLYVSFTCVILFSPASLMGTPNSMRMLYDTSLQNDS